MSEDGQSKGREHVGDVSRKDTRNFDSPGDEPDSDIEEQKTPDTSIGEEQLVGRIMCCIQQHQAIIKFSNNLNDLFSPMLLVQLLISYFAIGIFAFQTILFKDSSFILLKFVFTTVVMLLKLSLLCWIGTKFHEKSVAVSEAAYSCQWYDGSKQFKFCVQMIMLRAQLPLTLQTVKSYTVNLDTLVQILNASYSLLNLLREIHA